MTHLNPAPVTFVHTKVTLYHSNLVDLRVSRTVHSTESCSANQGTSLTGNKCGAVHYGRCTPVTLVSTSTLSTPPRSTLVSTPQNSTSTPPSPPRTMVNVVHIATQPRNTRTVTIGTVNSPVTVGIPPRGYSPITIETSPRKSPSPTRTITFETNPSGRGSPRQVTIETFPAASISPRSVAMEMYPRRGSPIRSLSPRSFVIETYPPNATRPKTFTIETRPVEATSASRHVTMSTRTIPIEIRPSIHNKPLPASPATPPRHVATNTITIPVTKSRVARVPGIPTGQPLHGGGAASPPRRPMSLDGLVSMVNGHGGESDLGSTSESGEGGGGGSGGGAGIGSRAIPAPVTSIPKLPSTARVAHLVRPAQNVVRTHYNLHRVPNYIRIADVVRAQQEREGIVGEPAGGEAPNLVGGEARSSGDEEPTSPGGSPTLHVLRQVTVHKALSMTPVLMNSVAIGFTKMHVLHSSRGTFRTLYWTI